MTYDLRVLGGFRLRAPNQAAGAELPDLEHLREYLRKAGLPA